MPKKAGPQTGPENAAATAAENIAVALFKAASLVFGIALTGAKKIPWGRWDVHAYGLLPIVSSSILLTFDGGRKSSLLVAWADGLLHDRLMDPLTALPWTAHCLILCLSCLFALAFALGIRPFQEKRAIQRAVDSLGLKTATGETPKVVSVTDGEGGKKSVLVASYGIGPDHYKAKRDDLQSCTEGRITAIERAKNPVFVEISIAGEGLPGRVGFDEFEPLLTKPGRFPVGRSDAGAVTGDINALPHLLIAGTTGGGKSVFFKQALLGLLASTDNLQMYLIDLKGGLEFREFGTLPNVGLVKSIDGAVRVLGRVKDEMGRRFDYLERKGGDKIETKRDGFDSIVVGIDEASVLYSPVPKDDGDHGQIAKARSLTEHISKLSRAANIHLIMATQRVTKESVDTRIQENVSGRMCFKLNTLEGSLRVLGDKSARDLPSIPGRGIWQCGHERAEVQAPHIGGAALAKRLRRIREEYQNGAKSLYGRMLETGRPSIEHERKNEQKPNNREEELEEI